VENLVSSLCFHIQLVYRYVAAMGNLEVVLPASEAATSGREPGDEPNTCSHLDV
jgi:hypothetical protein